MNRILIIAMIFSLPFSTCLGQRNIAGQYYGVQYGDTLDLFPNGTYGYHTPGLCFSPPHTYFGRYEVHDDTVFTSSTDGERNRLGNLLIVRKERNNEDWFWDVGMLVKIFYEKEVISNKLIGRLNDYTGLAGEGFKKSKDY